MNAAPSPCELSTSIHESCSGCPAGMSRAIRVIHLAVLPVEQLDARRRLLEDEDPAGAVRTDRLDLRVLAAGCATPRRRPGRPSARCTRPGRHRGARPRPRWTSGRRTRRWPCRRRPRVGGRSRRLRGAGRPRSGAPTDPPSACAPWPMNASPDRPVTVRIAYPVAATARTRSMVRRRRHGPGRRRPAGRPRRVDSADDRPRHPPRRDPLHRGDPGRLPRRATTSPTARSPRPSSSPSSSAGRCSSRARPASARPSWPRSSRRRSARG